MDARVETVGFDRILAKIPELLDTGADASANTTVTIAQANVPVGPVAPHTRDTIAKVVVGEGVRQVQAEEAAIVIELGTRSMPARPFLLPAALDDATLQAFINAVKDGLA